MSGGRLAAPDTQADKDLKSFLSTAPVQSFLMVAGAGSGKTTSLVKALSHLVETRGKELRRSGQQIACITYTEVAAGEIWNDVGNNPMFHVSTIHSFFWTLAKPYQSDVKIWVKGRIEEKLTELTQKIADFGPRVQQRTRDKAQADLAGLQQDLLKIDDVSEFRYGTGSDYEAGILGHDDIINIVPELLTTYPLLRQLVAQKYPYIFVDECQDTMPVVVDALKSLAGTINKWPCVGFFGDPMQRIFLSGAQTIGVSETWKTITKPENFRCPTEVLKVINNIRLEDDGLQQTMGRHEIVNGQSVPVSGAAHLFVLPADGQRRERMSAVRQWMKRKYEDPLWESDSADDGVKVLVIVHRMAATRLGFANLYAAFNDSGASSLKDGFIEGTAWALTPFLSYLLPLLAAAKDDRQFDVMSLLRAYCPLFERSKLKPGAAVAKHLDGLRNCVEELKGHFAQGSQSAVRDVLKLAQDEKLAEFDARILEHLGRQPAAGENPEDENGETRTMQAFLACPAVELLAYQVYIERLSPFATQQGIKGAEFERVLTVVDDEESTHFQFSYDKYFGIAPLSANDRKNIEEGKESVVDRTRRLFYVCCSRAERHLAVAVFVSDVNAATAAIIGKGLFEAGQVVPLTELEAAEAI